MTPDVKLPPFWKLEEHRPFRTFILSHPSYSGFMSISLVNRAYAPGQGRVDAHGLGYTGRGWQQRLVDDAMKALQEIFKD